MAKKVRAEQVDLSQYYNKSESTPLIQGANITITESEEGVIISSSGSGGGGSTAWGDITDKPATYAPSAHNHSVAEVTGLETTLTGLEDSVDNANTLVAGNNITLTPSGSNLIISASGSGGGSVAWGDVTDKPATFTPATHSHDEIDNAIDLTTIAGYNGTVKQYLTHNASGVLRWENS